MKRPNHFRGLRRFQAAVKGNRDRAINTALCQKLLANIISFAKNVADNRVYPCVLRINREVTDECGRTYVESVDETGRPWTI